MDALSTERGSRHWRVVGLVMAAASAYDLAFGIGILVLRRSLAAMLSIPLPEDGTYLGLVGVLLLVLGALYVLPARDPVRFAPVVAISAVGRLLGCAYLAWVWTRGHPPAFLGLAAGDLAFAAAQTIVLVRAYRAVQR